MLPDVEYTTPVEIKLISDSTPDYATLLSSLNLQYKIAGLYYQVGEITKVQGWILHISLVISQIKEALEIIAPILAKGKTPFKIIRDQSTAEDLLNGNFGIAQIGKIVSIYSENDDTLVDLAKKLNGLTYKYKGPFIPTDARLGNVVYTRFGSFNPIIKQNKNGAEEKYIYNGKGQLVVDLYSMPFQIPENILWPFIEITTPILQSPPKLLNRIYKLIDILKADPRGSVFKGLYYQNLLKVKTCVIKQGIANMSSDLAGRDIQDRLIWQYKLYKDLSPFVPMPKIYDIIKQEDSTLLIMEYIKGDSLFDKLAEDNPYSKTWQELSINENIRILDYVIDITKIIEKMHCNGYVHRDVVPVNFLIDKKDRITLIDIELAYSLKQNQPNPPFTLGTFGFMSPEQAGSQLPTIKEDIYGLGATLIYTLTGILPIQLNSENTEELTENLYYLIAHRPIAQIIASCLKQSSTLRPTITIVSQALIEYRSNITNIPKPSMRKLVDENLDRGRLTDTISAALDGLTKSPVLIYDHFWFSKQITIENFTSPKNKQYKVGHGLTEGLSGILYLLARTAKLGISIEPCIKSFVMSWDHIEQNYIKGVNKMSPGLYQGTYGIGLALAEAIKSNLLEDNDSNKGKIQACLCIENENINLANGAAGQGVSLLLCKDILESNAWTLQLSKIVDSLLLRQQKGGSWREASGFGKINSNLILNMGYDDTGIVWFLLEHYSINRNASVGSSIVNALNKITTNRALLSYFYNLVASRKSYEIGDGGKGLILLFIKAYEVLGNLKYKQIAETALQKYPAYISHSNFSQENGLAGIGEIYLEAWRVFRNEEWLARAKWIACLFIHTIIKKRDGSGHWKMEQNNPPTADLFTGNSGIIHFLARIFNQNQIGYRVLK
jgi:serine/threonine protein kinase